MSEIKNNLDDLKIDRSEQPEGGSKGWVVAVVAVVLLGSLAGWWWFRPRVLQVQTAVARPANTDGGRQTVLNASGYVTARRQATVSSKVTGKVTEVLIEEGMTVEEGQVLARLDLSNVNASLNLADAELGAARTALTETRVRVHEAELELARIKNLVESQISSAADLDQAQAEVDSLKARLDRQAEEVKVAENRVGLWRQEVEDRIIRAPFTGVVVSKNAQPGEMISPVSAGGGFTRTGICTIVDMESLEIEVDVNEAYINRVSADQSVVATLDSYPDWKIPASVIAIIPTADRQRATVRVRVRFEEMDSRILPDMGVKVAFQEIRDATTEAGSGGVLIPKGAIHRDGERDVVWVVAEGVAERRAVTVELSDGEDARVAAGLTAGEIVVLEALPDLSGGDRVQEVDK